MKKIYRTHFVGDHIKDGVLDWPSEKKALQYIKNQHLLGYIRTWYEEVIVDG